LRAGAVAVMMMAVAAVPVAIAPHLGFLSPQAFR
jgi:hypothetical protein